MRKIRCPYCGFSCRRHGKTSAGTQRWYCSNCKIAFTSKNDHQLKDFNLFQEWLFGKNVQKEMPGKGRTFRRKISRFWDIWPLPPRIEDQHAIVFVDGIYLARKACILICCDEHHVLGWYLCRYEHSGAWEALMARIATPKFVVSDGGSGFRKAMKKVWKTARLQRCTFHAFCQVKRYTTTRPKTLAGMELYEIAKDLLHIKNEGQAFAWMIRLEGWNQRHKKFLMEQTRDENGKLRYTHERLLKANRSLLRLIQTKTLFTYLDKSILNGVKGPATNNRIEGGVNAQLRSMLRNHRGLSIEKRIQAVFWWCYMHSPKPLSSTEILKVMPTNESISDIYNTMNERGKLEGSIPTWGDAVVWGELHKTDFDISFYWD